MHKSFPKTPSRLGNKLVLVLGTPHFAATQSAQYQGKITKCDLLTQPDNIGDMCSGYTAEADVARRWSSVSEFVDRGSLKDPEKRVSPGSYSLICGIPP
ncbi:hypothetical protein BDZ45DRAFT_468036 [Acephala macrosclerotiorum]|nr:hypothetical protein BDZ45DRAFT_468036 [Acephala macrosclerotiorum]